MGGGAAMRAASKVAGIGVVHAGIRSGLASSSPAELKNVSRPVSTILTSSGTSGDLPTTAVQRPAWDLEDWELAGGVEDEFGMTADPLPRVVFGAGGAPSLQEAKAATAELKDAINKVYLSGSASSFGGVQQSVLPLPLSAKSDTFETKSCVTCDPEADIHTMMAFRLLNESPEAQSVVASIACDPNVWDAVLKNESLQQFLQSQTPKVETEDLASTVKITELSDDESEGESSDAKTGFWDDVKQSVVDMVRNVSAYLENIFVVPSAEKSTAETDPDEPFKKTLGASLMGLAMLVVMVVIFKRV